MSEYWVSCSKFTGYVRTEGNIIVETAPIMQKFKGQTLLALFAWINNNFKGLIVKEIDTEKEQ